jgi:hypothetical protein
MVNATELIRERVKAKIEASEMALIQCEDSLNTTRILTGMIHSLTEVLVICDDVDREMQVLLQHYWEDTNDNKANTLRKGK